MNSDRHDSSAKLKNVLELVENYRGQENANKENKKVGLKSRCTKGKKYGLKEEEIKYEQIMDLRRLKIRNRGGKRKNSINNRVEWIKTQRRNFKKEHH